MIIKFQQFLYQNHSWSIVSWNLAQAMMNIGHSVDLFPTDKNKPCHLPEEFKKYEVEILDKTYDCQIGYTSPVNWHIYFRNGDKNRFAIWNYEYRGDGILPGFAKYYKSVDKILPSSNFSKEVFLDMGVPEDRLIVVPHGIDLLKFENKNKYVLNTKKKYKILLNIAQVHLRKNLSGALKVFGEAFKKSDDVCLVAKVSTANKSDQQFNVDFHDIYRNFCHHYPKHAEVEIITKYIPDIVELYNACDINFSATFTECWHLPSLEALAAGLINVVPRYGGILHFCNDDNSILIDGKIVRAPKAHQYWSPSLHSVHFAIDTGDAVNKLRMAVEHHDELKEKMSQAMKETAERYTWANAAKQIIELTK